MLTLLEMLLPLIAVILVIAPLFFIYKKGASAENLKTKLIAQICVFGGVFVLAVLFQFGGVHALAEGTAAANSITGTLAQGMGFIAAALATGCSAIGARLGGGFRGSGSDRSDLRRIRKTLVRRSSSSRWAEGVAIYGLLISILIHQ